MPSLDQIKADILHKLFRKRKWGASHTSVDNLHKSCPSHLKGAYKETSRQLIQDGFLLVKPTGYGLEVSLNPEKREEIIATVRRFFEDLL
ncbi:MAG: hypothetical protein V1722_04610 [Candidatus Micrarchaeota archaeon]